MYHRMYLNVPYEEKDEAKHLGARWDTKVKKWYIPLSKDDFNDYRPFFRWMLGNSNFAIIPKDELFIMETRKTCWKCGKKTKVMAFSVNNYVTLEADDEILLEDYWEEYLDRDNPFLLIFPETEADIPLCIRNYVKEHYHVGNRYSKTLGREQFANYCEHCNALQGNFHLFEEPSSPFWPNRSNEEKIRLISIIVDDTAALNWNALLEMDYHDYAKRLVYEDVELDVNDSFYNFKK